MLSYYYKARKTRETLINMRHC